MMTRQLTPVDPTTFRDAIRHQATGVAIITSVDQQAPVGMTVSTVVSHSIDPPTVSCNLALTSSTLAAIRSARRYAVHLLDASQGALALRFADPDVDRFADTDWDWDHDLPVLAGVLARFHCELLADLEVGDHTIVLGTVVHAETDTTRSPLIHHNRQFRHLDTC